MSILLHFIILALVALTLRAIFRPRTHPSTPTRQRTEFETRSRFQSLGANQVTIRLDEDRSGKVAQAAAVTSVQISLQISPADAMRAISGLSDLVLFDCWTRLPISAQPGTLEDYPVLVHDPVDGNATMTHHQRRTRFTLPHAQIEPNGQSIQISFSAANIVHSLEGRRKPSNLFTAYLTRFLDGRPPFVLQALDFNFDPQIAMKHSVFSVDYPKSLAPRRRSVRAIYRTRTAAVDKEVHRQVVLVDQAPTNLRFTFSSDNDVELSAPAFPLVRVGLSFLALAVALTLFDDSGKPESVDVIFGSGHILIGAVVATSLVESYRRNRFFFPSQIRGKLSVESVTLILAGVSFFVFFLLTLRQLDEGCLTISQVEVSICVNAHLMLLGAGIFLTLAFLYFLMLQTGRLQYFACDYCGERTPIDPFSGAGEHPETGEWLCKNHLNRPDPRYINSSPYPD